MAAASRPSPPRDTRPDAERLLHQQESLREVIESISSELELRPLLTRIVRQACELLGATDGTIGLYDEERCVIRTEAMHLMPPGEMGAEMAPGVGLAGQVLLTRAPVVLDRYDRLPRMTVPALADQAVLGVPIEWRGRLIGFFGVGARPPRRFDGHDVEMLALLARHTAIAIENARQYEREARRTERLGLIARIGRTISSALHSDELLQAAADEIHQALGYANVGIGLIDPDDPETIVIRTFGGEFRDILRGEHRFSITQGVMGAAARERRAQLVADVRTDPRHLPTPGATGIRSELAVPILLGDQVLGVVNVEGPRPFSGEDATSLQIVADTLAVAIRNVRLFENAQRLAVLEERQRLARDLHDSITQMVFSASLLAQSIDPAWRRDPSEGARLTERVVTLIRNAQTELRHMLHELQPAAPPDDDGAETGLVPIRERLRREGLMAMVRGDMAQDAGEPILTLLELDGYPSQPPALEEVLYRVFQEAVHNVRKHARARTVRVALGADGSGVVLRVVDDGVGFASGRVQPHDGRCLGLRHMRERVEAAGGTIAIESSPGRGTTVAVRLPRAEERA